jgi:hypothetical protein
MSAPSNSYIDGEALIRARRRGRRALKRLVEHYKSLGATEAEIAHTMSRARGLISPLNLGGQR